MHSIAFENITKPLLFLHLVAGVICVATSVHLLLRTIRAAGRPGAFGGQMRLHAQILGTAYLTSALLGGLIYPVFRVHVRFDLLDTAFPWATGLFEIKELLSTVAVIPVLGIMALSRDLDFRDRTHRSYLPLYMGLVGFVLGVVVYNAWCGWYLGTIRSV